ncbi:hypothetical protein DYB32_000102 [Aphanomyces invadans]|uniref:Integrator complex subunit 1 RPB2-binding domain-containing protein n=1 Tax=Aphanomyces invadans TaxID=157072 RepID=A0A418BB23_9STRA|nr:hypothetical protein DYB32_000102 [Aphanomyces invadans]
MKRVVYDESDSSSDPDEKKKDATSAKEESDAEEELDDAEMEEEDEDDTVPQEPPEPPAENISEMQNSKNEVEKEIAEDDDDDEAHEEEDDEDEEDIFQLLESAQDDESIQKLIQNSLGQLAREGSSPSRDLVLAYAASVSANSTKFQHPSTLKALLRLLRSSVGRERSSSIEKKSSKPKPPRDPVKPGGITLTALVANLLAAILKPVPQVQWPDDCLKVFVDDSLHSRAWVDHDMSAVFVSMIKAQIQNHPSAEVAQRVMEHLSSKVNEIKRGGVVMNNPTMVKNVMLTLMDLAPLPQGRLIASSNLELWFQNSIHKTIARDFLLKIVRSCTTLEAHDLETVENLLNMKFKSVSFPQLKTEVFTLLVHQRPEYINIAIKVVLLKERLAATLKDVDNLKMMPLIFRETVQIVIRSLGPDQLDVRALCQGLMSVPTSMQSLDFFVVMGELVALVLFVQGTAVRSLQVNVQEPAANSRLNLLPKALDKGVRRLGTAPSSNISTSGIVTSAAVAAGSQKRQSGKDTQEKLPITPAVKAKEELAQLIADVQRMAVNWCHQVQQLGDQLGIRLFSAVMRKVLFLDMLVEMQVLIAFNPAPLGASVWDGVPTMRALMQMVITGRYTFPPVEPEDIKLFDTQPPSMTLLQANQIFTDREHALFEAHKLPIDHSLMLVQPLHSTARAPPLEVLRKVENLDKRLRLGVRLRKSRTKDFLMDMVDVTVSDKAPHSSWSESPERIWWIVEIVCDENDTLSYLPRRCLCELLLLSCVDGSGEKSKFMHAMLLQQVPTLLQRLKVRNISPAIKF